MQALEAQFLVTYLSTSQLSVNHLSAFSINFEDLRFRLSVRKKAPHLSAGS